VPTFVLLEVARRNVEDDALVVAGVLLGLNEPVTPAGSEPVVSATAPAKGAVRATFTVVATISPGLALSALGALDRANEPASEPVTVSAAVMDAVVEPLAVATTSVEVPAGVVVDVVTDSVVLTVGTDFDTTTAGEAKLAMVPAGSPLTDSGSVPANPLLPVAVIE
jgi:hypothetical protein